MTREELTAAWLLICSTSKDGDFSVSRKKGEWSIKISTLMDATMAQQIMSFIAQKEDEEDDWHPRMFE